MSMSQPAISCGLAARPMPSRFAAAPCAAGFCAAGFCGEAFGAAAMIPAPVTTPASAPRASTTSLADLDILDLAILVQLPRLDAVVVIDRVEAAILAQLGLARLHIAAFIHGTRLQQQLAAVPVELVIEARQRLVPGRPVDPRGAPVASAVKRNVDARDLAAARPGDARQHGEAGLMLDRRLRAWVGDDRLRLHQIGEAPRLAVFEQVGVF